MKAKASWLGGMSFEGTADSGFTVRLGTSAVSGGNDEGLSPMEIVLIGLAGCTGMDVISILKKKQQKVTGFEVRVEAQRAEDHPKIFTNIQVEYYVKGENIDPAAVERSIELSETKYCSVSAMLKKSAKVSTSYKIENR
jgi:putative redox protein